MLKTLAIVIAGLAAGFALATWWPRSEPVPAPLTATLRDSPDSFAALKDTLLEEIEQRTALESRVQDLSARLDELRAAEAPLQSAARDSRETAEPTDSAEPAAASPSTGPQGPRFRGGPGRGGPETHEERVARFVAAGFPPDRAQWITQRAAELQMKMLEAQYNSRRDGTPFDPGVAGGGEQTLRTELGDSDYERYLDALGRPTSVAVGNVLASSPAESAGLKSGDEIVSYAGERVFDMRELNRLTLEGQRGESVIVEVQRDGRRQQLILPRGPVGITGGRFGGRP